MATKVYTEICDRCGRETSYTRIGADLGVSITALYDYRRNFDLCRDCKPSLLSTIDKWFEERPIEKKRKTIWSRIFRTEKDQP